MTVLDCVRCGQQGFHVHCLHTYLRGVRSGVGAKCGFPCPMGSSALTKLTVHCRGEVMKTHFRKKKKKKTAPVQPVSRFAKHKSKNGESENVQGGSKPKGTANKEKKVPSSISISHLACLTKQLLNLGQRRRAQRSSHGNCSATSRSTYFG